MMAEWSAKALPCIVGNLKVVDATERALTFESTVR